MSCAPDIALSGLAMLCLGEQAQLYEVIGELMSLEPSCDEWNL